MVRLRLEPIKFTQHSDRREEYWLLGISMQVCRVFLWMITRITKDLVIYLPLRSPRCDKCHILLRIVGWKYVLCCSVHHHQKNKLIPIFKNLGARTQCPLPCLAVLSKFNVWWVLRLSVWAGVALLHSNIQLCYAFGTLSSQASGCWVRSSAVIFQAAFR